MGKRIGILVLYTVDILNMLFAFHPRFTPGVNHIRLFQSRLVINLNLLMDERIEESLGHSDF
jgi:hypothetical protein